MLDLSHNKAMDGSAFFHHSFQKDVSDGNISCENWRPPVIKTVAIKDEGIESLFEQISLHRSFLTSQGGWAQKDQLRLKNELDQILQDAVLRQWRDQIDRQRYDEVLLGLSNRLFSPGEAAKKIIKNE